MKIKQLALDSMLAAMCAILGYLALDLGSLKFTFESLPVLLGALLFGPIDGMLIGGVGTLLYQLLRYGVTATTALWILPYVMAGLVAGLFAKRGHFQLNRAQTMVVVIAAELMITLMNTGVIYVDSRLYGYYTPALIWGALGLRLVICVGKAVAYGAILPPLLRTLQGTALRHVG